MIHHGDTEARSTLLHEELTERDIGAAIEVHRALDPAFLSARTKNAFATNCICGDSAHCLRGE
jgi:hypothetical protein